MSSKYKVSDDLCNAGNFCVDGRIGVCPAGEYQPGQGNSNCTDYPTSLQCVPDTLATFTTIVSECPAESFCNGTGPSQPCPAGTYRDIDAGQDQISKCLLCPYGHFCNGGTGLLTSNTRCNNGYECDKGSDMIDNKPCSDGYYCIQGKKRSCDAG